MFDGGERERTICRERGDGRNRERGGGRLGRKFNSSTATSEEKRQGFFPSLSLSSESGGKAPRLMEEVAELCEKWEEEEEGRKRRRRRRRRRRRSRRRRKDYDKNYNN